MANANIDFTTGSNVLERKLGKTILASAQAKSIIHSFCQTPASESALISAPGVKIAGSQEMTGAPGFQYYEYRMRSHLSPYTIDPAHTMTGNAEKFFYDTVRGTRHFYAKVASTRYIDLSRVDFDLVKDIVTELKDWVQVTPFDAQYFFNLSPTASAAFNSTDITTYGTDLATLEATGMTAYLYDSGSTWYNIRDYALERNALIFDLAKIGYPVGNGPTTYCKNVRCAFLSKLTGIDRSEAANKWTNLTDDAEPTVQNLRAYRNYLFNQGYKEPTFTFDGKSYTGFVTFVEDGFMVKLQEDSEWKDAQNWIEPKGDANTFFSGVRGMLKLGGQYFIPVQRDDSNFKNRTPLYSQQLSDTSKSKFIGVTLTAGSFMTSMYESPVLTVHDPDHKGNATEWGIRIMIGSRVLQDLVNVYSSGAISTPTKKDRVCYLLYVAPSNS